MKHFKFNLTTPVLFMIFNRLDTTKKVFEEIKKAKPKQLFLASDGPRENKEGEKEKVEEVRKYVLDNIDWKCEVKTLFREKNLGCKYAVSGAIDWFFENVEEGIILEDDVLPNQSFFRFCQEMLERYRDYKGIGIISGYNPINVKKINSDYFFSENTFIWGWATWKRVWAFYDVDMKMPSKKDFRKIYPNIFERFYKKKKIRDALRGIVNTWDTQLGFINNFIRSINIVPKKNLIKNLGFSDNGSTHTKENKWDNKFLNRNSHELMFSLKHPNQIKSNKKFDKKYIMQDFKRIISKKLF